MSTNAMSYVVIVRYTTILTAKVKTFIRLCCSAHVL